MTEGGEKPKVVLAYSGGLDTSVILVWLIEKVRPHHSTHHTLLPPAFLHDVVQTYVATVCSAQGLNVADGR